MNLLLANPPRRRRRRSARRKAHRRRRVRTFRNPPMARSRRRRSSSRRRSSRRGFVSTGGMMSLAIPAAAATAGYLAPAMILPKLPLPTSLQAGYGRVAAVAGLGVATYMLLRRRAPKIAMPLALGMLVNAGVSAVAAVQAGTAAGAATSTTAANTLHGFRGLGRRGLGAVGLPRGVDYAATASRPLQGLGDSGMNQFNGPLSPLRR